MIRAAVQAIDAQAQKAGRGRSWSQDQPGILGLNAVLC